MARCRVAFRNANQWIPKRTQQSRHWSCRGSGSPSAWLEANRPHMFRISECAPFPPLDRRCGHRPGHVPLAPLPHVLELGCAVWTSRLRPLGSKWRERINRRISRLEVGFHDEHCGAIQSKWHRPQDPRNKRSSEPEAPDSRQISPPQPDPCRHGTMDGFLVDGSKRCMVQNSLFMAHLAQGSLARRERPGGMGHFGRNLLREIFPLHQCEQRQ